MAGRAAKLAALLMVADVPIHASAQTKVENPGDPYVHELTGVHFPMQIGEFQRHQVTRYAADGSDMGFGYQLIRAGQKIGYVSIFVYPATPVPTGTTAESAKDASCKAEFSQITRSLLSHEPDAKLTSKGPAQSPSKLFRAEGLRAIFEGGKAKFDGKDGQIVHEEAYLYCYAGGRWLVSYRITWPMGPDLSADFDKLMRSIEWTDGLER